MRTVLLTILLAVLGITITLGASNRTDEKILSPSITSGSSNWANPIHQKPQWVTLITDEAQGIKYDVDLSSVVFSSYNQFMYIHRIVFKQPVSTDKGKFQYAFFLSQGKCTEWTTKTLADVETLNDSIVSKNIFNSQPEVKPDAGSFSDQVLKYACKLRERVWV